MRLLSTSIFSRCICCTRAIRCRWRGWSWCWIWWRYCRDGDDIDAVVPDNSEMKEHYTSKTRMRVPPEALKLRNYEVIARHQKRSGWWMRLLERLDISRTLTTLLFLTAHSMTTLRGVTPTTQYIT
ncbi:hypothetical protein BDQ17DRAFT_964336 [Cyathus striatus]|nr:hypothetical protein BDQ17DRAFT_964336 [Cyathus striatus]